MPSCAGLKRRKLSKNGENIVALANLAVPFLEECFWIWAILLALSCGFVGLRAPIAARFGPSWRSSWLEVRARLVSKPKLVSKRLLICFWTQKWPKLSIDAVKLRLNSSQVGPKHKPSCTNKLAQMPNKKQVCWFKSWMFCQRKRPGRFTNHNGPNFQSQYVDYLP